MTVDAPTRPRFWTAPAGWAGVLIWTAALAVLLLVHRPTACFALAVAGYGVFLVAVAAWLMPAMPTQSDDVLQASSTGGRLVARWAVVAASVALVSAYGAAYAGLATGHTIPLLTPLVLTLRDVRV